MTSADEECGAKAVGAGAEVALAASRSGMGLGEGAALPEDAGSAMSLGAGAVVTAAAWIEGTGVETSLAGAMSTAWAGRGAGVDSSTGVRPALRAASRLAPSATTPMGGRLCPRSAAISAGQSMVSSTRLASTTTGSFSKKLPASAMRLASAALRRSGSALCRTTRIAYRVALLKSRARDSVFILVWDGGRAREKGPFRRRADVGHDNPPGRFLPVWLREIGVFSAFATGPDVASTARSGLGDAKGRPEAPFSRSNRNQPCAHESRRVTTRFRTGFSAVDSFRSAVK